MNNEKWKNQLLQLKEIGILSEFDLRFGDFIVRRNGGGSPILHLTAVLLSHAVGQGHTCLDLAACANTPFPPENDWSRQVAARDGDVPELCLPALADWLEALDKAGNAVGNEGRAPLVLAGERVYLHRFFQDEISVARELLARAGSALPQFADPQQEASLIRGMLDRLFPDSGQTGPDWPRIAAFAATRRKLLIVSGGPGTGKTYTAARILALLAERHAALNPDTPPLRIQLAAPTGKAASRLQDSLADALNATGPGVLTVSAAVREALEVPAVTLHRLLGLGIKSKNKVKNRQQPLSSEVVLVDEASMIPLPLMQRLLDALAPTASLILLGDMNQLAAIDPGQVLQDIRSAADPGRFSAEFIRDCAAISGESLPTEYCVRSEPFPPLTDVCVELTVSRRFAPESGVARLSAAIKATRTPEQAESVPVLLHQLNAEPQSGIRFIPDNVNFPVRTPAGTIAPWLQKQIRAQFAAFCRAETPKQALAALGNFRILCAVHLGDRGVEEWNNLVESVLFAHRDRGNLFYHLRPILITRNNYPTELYNGDIGVIWRDPNSPEAAPAAWFPGVHGAAEPRSLPCTLLPPHQTVFAMTVHKSQGSQFRNLLLVLPKKDHGLFTRELLYTAITRVVDTAWIYGSESGVKKAACTGLQRSSGLADRLRS